MATSVVAGSVTPSRRRHRRPERRLGLEVTLEKVEGRGRVCRLRRRDLLPPLPFGAA